MDLFFCLSISFSIFCNSFVPDFKNLHNLIHLNDCSNTNTIFDDFSINESENSKSCETIPSSNMQGNMKQKYVTVD